MTGTMTHNILLTRYLGTKREKGKQFYLPGVGSLRTRTVDSMSRQRREGWLQHYPLSHDQARCIHPPFAEFYAIQAFSIASDFDPQQMPKKQNQITMRKVCIVIKSLVSRRPHHHSSNSQDREKHHTLLTLKRRKNVVHDVTNVEQHELFGLDNTGILNTSLFRFTYINGRHKALKFWGEGSGLALTMYSNGT